MKTCWSTFFLLQDHPDCLMSKVGQTDALTDFKVKSLHKKWRKIVNLIFWLPVFAVLLLPKNVTSSLMSSRGNTWDLLGRDFLYSRSTACTTYSNIWWKVMATISCTSLQRSMQLFIKRIDVICIILVNWRQRYKLILQFQGSCSYSETAVLEHFGISL